MEKQLDKKYFDKAFSQHRLNGFRLKFPNGNGLSTIWGYCTYSDNNMNSSLDNMNNPVEAFGTPLGSNTVEIMPDCSDKLLKKLQKKYPDNENGSVFSYLSMEQWLEIVNILKKAK